MNADDRKLISTLIEETQVQNELLRCLCSDSAEGRKLAANLGTAQTERDRDTFAKLSQIHERLETGNEQRKTYHASAQEVQREIQDERRDWHTADTERYDSKSNRGFNTLLGYGVIRLVVELGIFAALVYPIIERLN